MARPANSEDSSEEEAPSSASMSEEEQRDVGEENLDEEDVEELEAVGRTASPDEDDAGGEDNSQSTEDDVVKESDDEEEVTDGRRACRWCRVLICEIWGFRCPLHRFSWHFRLCFGGDLFSRLNTVFLIVKCILHIYTSDNLVIVLMLVFYILWIRQRISSLSASAQNPENQ